MLYEKFTFKCLKTDQISIIRKKCDIKGELLTYNYIILNESLNFKEYEDNGIMKFPVIIVKSIKPQNIIFKDTSGFSICIPVTSDCPINAALMNYLLITVNPFELFLTLNNGIKTTFSYNVSLLSINDKTPVAKIFINNTNPIVLVNKIK